jgi:hypothetical protein
MTTQLQRLAGVHNNKITREKFIEGVSQSTSSSDSDSWNMYLAKNEAEFLADAIFNGETEYEMSKFAEILANLDMKTGHRGHLK